MEKEIVKEFIDDVIKLYEVYNSMEMIKDKKFPEKRLSELFYFYLNKILDIRLDDILKNYLGDKK